MSLRQNLPAIVLLAGLAAPLGCGADRTAPPPDPAAAPPALPVAPTPAPVAPPPASAATTPAPTLTPVTPSKRLVVLARLVDPGRWVPACGQGYFVQVMRYEVVQVVEGSYGDKDLYVAVGCPEMSQPQVKGADGKFTAAPFHVGDLHHLELKKGAGDGGLVDAFKKSKLPRYRLVRAELVTAAP